MTAKEMFEELGYEQVEKTENSVRYEGLPTVVGDYMFYIEIWRREEFGDDFLIRKSLISREFVSNIWGEELKAINKQIEEFGWK